MKIKRKSDGKTFVFEIIQYSRGEWAYALRSVDDVRSYGACSDPDFTTERACRAYIRETIENYEFHSRYGWCKTG